MSAAVIPLVELRGQVEALVTLGAALLPKIDRCIASGITNLETPLPAKAPFNRDDPRDKNLSIKDVSRLVGLSATTIRRKIKEERFPEGTNISDGRVAWAYRDIEPFILQCQR